MALRALAPLETVPLDVALAATLAALALLAAWAWVRGSTVKATAQHSTSILGKVDHFKLGTVFPGFDPCKSVGYSKKLRNIKCLRPVSQADPKLRGNPDTLPS